MISTTSHGRAGGQHGYATMLATLADPSHAEHLCARE
jgi:hypothetical protein